MFLLVLFTILHSKANKLRWWIFIKHKLVICYTITWLERYVVLYQGSGVACIEPTHCLQSRSRWMNQTRVLWYGDVLLHFVSGRDTGSCFCVETDSKTSLKLSSYFTFILFQLIFIMTKPAQLELISITNWDWEFMWLCTACIGLF